MKKNLLRVGLIASILVTGTLSASTKNDMKFLGYSDELTEEIVKTMKSVQGDEYYDDQVEQEPKLIEVDEATSVKEQLVELAKTRSLEANLADKSQEIKEKIDGYWSNMNSSDEDFALSDELRSQILAGIREALSIRGFSIIQLELLDLPEGSEQKQFRAVARVTRPLKTKNSYKEIQANLVEIREACGQAATIDGINYLSELTTFVAENPKNKYYYEKTILNY